MSRPSRLAILPLAALSLAAASCGKAELEAKLRAAEARATQEADARQAARDQLAAIEKRAGELEAAAKRAVDEAAAEKARADAAEKEKTASEAKAAKAAEEAAEKAKKDLEKVTAHRDEMREWIEADLLPLAEKQSPELVNLKTATELMGAEVARLRGLEWKHPVMRRRIRREQVGEWMRRDLRKEITEADAKEMVLVGAEMGLVPAGTDIYAIFGEFLEGGAAAFYKPDTRTFYHIEGNDGRGAYPVVFHELVHAIEDQHFDLDAIYRTADGDSDRSLALRGLVEGSASLYEDLYKQENPKDAIEMMKSQSTPDMMKRQMRMLQRVPTFLVATMGLYPYNNGKSWLVELTKGDKDKVAALFAEPPSTTEQVLHPEKFADPAKRDWPHAVGVADLADVLPGWKTLDPDTMGELQLGCLLAQLRFPGMAATMNVLDPGTGGIAFKEPAKSAVAGWDGDRYVAAIDPATGRATVVWNLVFDSEKDATEFLKAYAPLVAKKVSGNSGGEAVSPARCTETGTGRVSIVQQAGRRIAVVLGSPADKADALVAAALAVTVTPDARDAADADR